MCHLLSEGQACRGTASHQRPPFGRSPCPGLQVALLTSGISLKVRGSLPTELCQQLDTGGVRLEVTRITNGSVMVEFHVLIIADVDVGEVSAAFLAALQNMTMLEVVPSDTFLQGTWGQGPEGRGDSGHPKVPLGASLRMSWIRQDPLSFLTVIGNFLSRLQMAGSLEAPQGAVPVLPLHLPQG